MKKLLLILLILQIFCIASFAQEKKPTKQETMDWISKKFEHDFAGPRNLGSALISITSVENKNNVLFITEEIRHRTMTLRSLNKIYLNRVSGVGKTTDASVTGG